MSPRWSKVLATVPAALLLAFASPSFASINLAGALMVPTSSPSKYCSGAFRYAARDGNSDIVPLGAGQAFANDRRFARTRYSLLAMSGLEGERSRLHALNTMCGAR
ncbi:MAG: hypothetical protein QOG38_899 [Hyphomicrobiales bacterium]|jgi:hypothetical protein|nr:hypothetical protein [Hyphomicrobiales bacterium]